MKITILQIAIIYSFLAFFISCKKENIIVQEPIPVENKDNLSGRKIKLSISITDALQSGFKLGDTIFVSLVMNGKTDTSMIFMNEMATFGNLASGVVEVRVTSKSFYTTFIQVDLSDIPDTFTYDTENFRNVALHVAMIPKIQTQASSVSGRILADTDAAQAGFENLSTYNGELFFKISKSYFTEKLQSSNVCKIVSASLSEMAFKANIAAGKYTVQLPMVADVLKYEMYASDFQANQTQADGTIKQVYYRFSPLEISHFGLINKKQDIVFDALP